MAATQAQVTGDSTNYELELTDSSTSNTNPTIIGSVTKNPNSISFQPNDTRESSPSSNSNDQNCLPSSVNLEPSRSQLVKDVSSTQNVSDSVSTTATGLQNTAPVRPITAASTSTTPPRPTNEFEAYYYVKWVTFEGRRVPIIMQNANGPCPLLALCNVLLLRQRFQLISGTEVVESTQLLEGLANCMLENRRPGLTDEQAANYNQNMHDTIELVFPKLHTGLDVNVKFDRFAFSFVTPFFLLRPNYLARQNDFATLHFCFLLFDSTV